MTKLDDAGKARLKLVRLLNAARKARIDFAREMLRTGDRRLAALKNRPHPRAWFAQRRETAMDFLRWALDDNDRKPMDFQVHATELALKAVAGELQ